MVVHKNKSVKKRGGLKICVTSLKYGLEVMLNPIEKSDCHSKLRQESHLRRKFKITLSLFPLFQFVNFYSFRELFFRFKGPFK